MNSFSSLEVKRRLRSESNLAKLSALINWSGFENILSVIGNSETILGCRRPYNKISMLKLILLGQWNSMSDEQLEEALRVRLDFISFYGIIAVVVVVVLCDSFSSRYVVKWKLT